MADSHNRRSARRSPRRSPHPMGVFHPFTPEQLAQRASAIPVITFPDLPVSERRDEIAQAIRTHQVVIVSGETGSGKTTQLPKICLQLGRGVAGMIGHTQPRRLAARAVADRIAEEMGQKVGKAPGDVVGYQVRFTDEVGPTTLVKLMTDGILLAEIQSDPMLRRYDTLIIDEAHERSLNIDFLLGYLARLLPARPDLKVIITSATIDSARFARHFGRWEGAPGVGRLIEPAPVIEVSGRTYPVEIRYRPLSPTLPSAYSSADEAEAPHDSSSSYGPQQLVLEDPDDDLPTLGYGAGEDIDVESAICHAVDELCAEGEGDILVFLPGERDIRDTESALLDHLGPRGRRAGDTAGARASDIEILPLFARLTAAEQHRIFEPHRLRRVVLSTNVAETSLTVPGIRYVIDPGLARISRFSNKTKVQRLPIEAISQASANQRAGRSGRVADGVAIRLYSQDDYESRPRFTEPEILRTSLASVILQMSALGLGQVEDFPFLDAPDRRAVRDGVALLVEIGALEGDHASSGEYRLTRVGRTLARLPIDPRLGRMLVEADAHGCASEVLVIVAALSIQDVRERPADHQGAADASHARLADPHSDFVTYLNVWRYMAVQARDLSGSAFRRLCRAEFLHYLRWREWRDVVSQLRQMSRALGIDVHPVGEPSPRDVIDEAERGGIQDAAARAVVAYGRGPRAVDADQIHRSLLVGLLSNLGSWDVGKRDYEGARSTHFTIWPGSGVKGHPEWVMTAELVETSRLFARTVARIRPEWIEPVAAALLKRSYSEPFWSIAKGAALVRERVTLYGLTLAADREVLLGRLGSFVIDEVAPSPAHFEELSTLSQDHTARELARELFIRNALVEGAWRERHAFQKKNETLVENAREVERRSRTHGLVADEQARFRFFDDIIPDHITSAASFNRWWKNERREHPDLLTYTPQLLLPRGRGDSRGFPDRWTSGELSLGLSYEFSPGSPRDGVSMRIPLEVLERVSEDGTDWLVPGMFEDLLTELIRALPKGKRRLLAPAPDVAAQVARWIDAEASSSTASPTASAVREAAPASSSSASSASASSGPEAESAPDPMSLDAAMSRLAQWGAASGMVSKRGSAAPAPATTPAQKSAAPTPASPNSGASSVEVKATPLRERPLMEVFAQAVRVLRGVELTPGECAHAVDHLPDHLRMTFVVVDGRGREVASGKDLPYLQRSLASRANDAVRTAVRAALEDAQRESGHASRRGKKKVQSSPDAQAGTQGMASPAGSKEKDRPGELPEDSTYHADAITVMPTLPRSITRTSSGMTLRAFPALVPQGTPEQARVGVRVMASAADADRLHREGLARLLLERLRLATARVTTRWSGREALMLAASPYSDTAALVADAQLASALSLVDELCTPADVRDAQSFEELARRARDLHEDRVYEILSHVVRVMEAVAESDAAVRGAPASLIAVREDVASHAATLTYDGFVSATPAFALPHVARYVRAGAVRIGRAGASAGALARDEEDMSRIHDVESRIHQARTALAARPYEAAPALALERARWMAEELRVSMFAQGLGTPHKVSVKRVLSVLAQAGVAS